VIQKREFTGFFVNTEGLKGEVLM